MRQPRIVPVADANGFELIRLESRSGLRAAFLRTGVLFSLGHPPTLINQVLPGPAEDGPNATAEITFCAACLDDHAGASAEGDAEHLRTVVAAAWDPLPDQPPESPGGSTSLFTHALWRHGISPTAADWDAWFPGARRHEERAADGALLAFFHGADTHVVARAKEASVLRPHGHILGSGEPRWIDGGHLGQADRVAIRILKRLGTAECLALAEHFRRIRAENLAAWGVEQRDTTGTHPSYTERIRTFEAECRS